MLLFISVAKADETFYLPLAWHVIIIGVSKYSCQLFVPMCCDKLLQKATKKAAEAVINWNVDFIRDHDGDRLIDEISEGYRRWLSLAK